MNCLLQLGLTSNCHSTNKQNIRLWIYQSPVHLMGSWNVLSVTPKGMLTTILPTHTHPPLLPRPHFLTLSSWQGALGTHKSSVYIAVWYHSKNIPVDGNEVPCNFVESFVPVKSALDFFFSFQQLEWKCVTGEGMCFSPLIYTKLAYQLVVPQAFVLAQGIVEEACWHFQEYFEGCKIHSIWIGIWTEGTRFNI